VWSVFIQEIAKVHKVGRVDGRKNFSCTLIAVLFKLKMSEEGENFKLSSGAETPGSSDAGTVKVSNATTSAATTVEGSVPGMAPIWAAPIPPGEDGPYYYYNHPGSMNFPQNGYFFQNFGPQPNMGM